MAAAKLDHEVWYLGVGDVDYAPNENLRARAHRAVYKQEDELKSFLIRAQDADQQGTIVLDDFDAVWLRNDSIQDLQNRPWATSMGVVFGQMLVDRGVTVVNDPVGLSRAGSKLYLQEFPADIRPCCIVTRHFEEIRDFIARVGRTIVKPLYGAQGRNVFVVEDEKDPNLKQIVAAIKEDGYVTAQEFVPGAEDGDLRLFLLEGELLKVNGTYAAFKRVPRGTDVRANISTGGKPEEARISERELMVVETMRDRLVYDGVFFVGIDLIGDKVVEINAESPGGMLVAVHHRHHDVGDDEIRTLVLDPLECRGTIAGNRDLMPRVLEDELVQKAKIRLVVNYQDPGHRVASLVGSQDGYNILGLISGPLQEGMEASTPGTKRLIPNVAPTGNHYLSSNGEPEPQTPVVCRINSPAELVEQRGHQLLGNAVAIVRQGDQHTIAFVPKRLKPDSRTPIAVGVVQEV